MLIQVKIYSKDKLRSDKFVTFMKKLKTKNSALLFKQKSQKKNRKFLTVLKSPHVNKTAQKQFEFLIRKHELNIFSSRKMLFFLYLKKIKSFVLPGLKMKIVGVSDKNLSVKVFKTFIDPNKINLKFMKRQKKMELSMLKYFKLFDIYGEKIVESMCKHIFSSVG